MILNNAQAALLTIFFFIGGPVMTLWALWWWPIPVISLLLIAFAVAILSMKEVKWK